MHSYDRALIVALRHRRITLGVMIATVAATGYLFVVIPKGFFPQQDTGLIIGISEAAPDVSPDGMKERQRAILEIAARDPAVASAVGYIGPGGPTVTENDGRVFITLKPHGERNVTADQVIARLTKAVQQVQGMRLYMQAAQDITIGSRLSKTQYQYTLVDIDQDELNLYASKLMAKLQDLPELTRCRQRSGGARPHPEGSDRPPGRGAVRHHAGDDRLHALRCVRPASHREDLRRAERVLRDSRSQSAISARTECAPAHLCPVPEQYNGAPEPNRQPDSGRYPDRRQSSGPVSVHHPELQSRAGRDDRRGRFSGAEGDRRSSLAASIATSFQGNAQAFQSSLSTTPPLILAALFAVYIILGMLYESTIHPLTILSTLPSAGLGALLTLMLVGRPLDVIGIIGIILLIGIVKKNGIMLVDVALEGQRHQGLSSEDAIHHACLLRFRPILMTTMCALFGGIPLMLGTGTGSEIRQPLGYAIVGGLLVSQVLTLFTTPIVFIYMDKIGQALSAPSSRQALRSCQRNAGRLSDDRLG